MAKKLICTICSREKRTDAGLMPAIKRYKSKRIVDVAKIAEELGLSFAILSGEYGLLKPDDEIPYYDHLLSEPEVEVLTAKVNDQMKDLGVGELVFYAKPREENWVPYYQVAEQVTWAQNIILTVVPYND